MDDAGSSHLFFSGPALPEGWGGARPGVGAWVGGDGPAGPKLGPVDLLLQAMQMLAEQDPLQGHLLGLDYGRAGPWAGPEPCQASGFPDSKLL